MRRCSWRRSISPARSRRAPTSVDPAQARGDRGVLAHVGVDEQRARPAPGRAPPPRACRAAPRATGARARRASTPCERGRRRTAGGADRRAAGPPPRRASRAKNGRYRCRPSRACQSRFQSSARPLPQPRSMTVSLGRRREKARSMSLRIFDPSSGGETRSWRASACSDSSRYFVCSLKCAVRPQVEIVGRRPRHSARPQASQVNSAGVPGQPAAARRAANQRQQSTARSRGPAADLDQQRLEPFGAALPRV